MASLLYSTQAVFRVFICKDICVLTTHVLTQISNRDLYSLFLVLKWEAVCYLCSVWVWISTGRSFRNFAFPKGLPNILCPPIGDRNPSARVHFGPLASPFYCIRRLVLALIASKFHRDRTPPTHMISKPLIL